MGYKWHGKAAQEAAELFLAQGGRGEQTKYCARAGVVLLLSTGGSLDTPALKCSARYCFAW